MKRIPTFFILALLTLTASIYVNAYSQTGGQSLTLNATQKIPTDGTEDLSPSDGSGVFHISKRPVLSLENFVNAKVSMKKNRTVLEITLNDSGSSKLREFSVDHVGQKLAILLNHRLIAAPVIRLPIDGKFQIDALSADEANNLAQVINKPH